MNTAPFRSLLDRIRTPSDLRVLPDADLPRVAAQLRDFLVRTVSGNGGHLAASLGTVELAIALHRVFDTPQDCVVWDVGHQAYPHKVLTGRRELLAQVRKRGGLSGFLRRDESEFDAFGAGHSSTSISAALGMAVAHQRIGSRRKAVAVIGDGALTAGLAFEALDHAGALTADVLIIVNDNGMSISPNVGALSRYLGSRGPDAPARWFEDLGLPCTGPVDGHDLPALLEALRTEHGRTGPRVLHVVTRKGHGYAPAEADPVKYHGVTPFDPARGIVSGAKTRTYTDVFGEWLCEMAARDPRLVAITPAMREGSGLTQFAQRYPNRYFDVGIAEQHSVTFAAGLACQGLRPVVAIYSTFLQRAFDQLAHDVSLQKLPVLFAIDRAGLVGPDGATHNGSFDLTYLRCLPGMTIMAPADEGELRDMLYTGYSLDGPAAVRYPRAAASGAERDKALSLLPAGTAQLCRSGSGIALLSFGTVTRAALEAAETLDATVLNMRFVKPLDTRLVLEAARQHELLVTLEENSIAGGAGSAVNECLAAHGVRTALLNLGLPDRYIEHGTREEVLAEAGLDREGILSAIAGRAVPANRAARLARRFRPAGAIIRALSVGQPW